MQSNSFWIFGVLILLLGIFVLVKQFMPKNKAAISQDAIPYKNGVPITPRSERHKVRELVEVKSDDALSNMAAVASFQPVSDHPQESVMHVETVEEFEQDSPILARHLSKQSAFEQNNDPLMNAQSTITIIISPRDGGVGISGRRMLELAHTYGLKYGVMNMFHRYSNTDGTGDLWFSAMGITYDGVLAFDLNTLADDHFTGLALFLSLPHPYALRGYDSMVGIAKMIADDVNADLCNEEMHLIDDAYLARLRAEVASYNS
ncbi:cell division protein ZipA C-terminal FtsZ-binding domain-containing protein [Moraxella nasovis]|uniref:cell division protein ZipA C-terminal FtsZ-binding domain-containing protein n=1 Tax=Moraxella nasovis TaxID=2904121 RepID=UPI001F6146D0|nr:cell division protein ZipA C-terminal FtsZ-binding domain-containing protein [Moraxella nasovis]UNU72635.1 cell division protein ZipA C-terminal FtsZ-binding domain-containing protein [Moraxella nasovis]